MSTIALASSDPNNPATLSVTGGANDSVVLQTVSTGFIGSVGYAAIHASGRNTLHVSDTVPKYGTETASLTIAPGGVVLGGMSLQGNQTFAMQGGKFSNSGSDLESAAVQINSAVVGQGSWNVGMFSRLEFISSVGYGQTIAMTAADTLQIDHPASFHALVNFAGGGGSAVNLSGLAADSWSYANDLLRFWNAGNVVDTVRFAASGGASSLSVFAGPTGLSVTPAGSGTPSGDTILPLHHAATV